MDVDPHTLAGEILRAMRAHARLSQRELAAAAGISVSTVARAERASGAAPSWASMVRAAEACGCEIAVVPAGRQDERLGPWRFDGTRDEGGRHLPAHLEVWRLGRAWEWSSFHKYSCYARPPFPEHSYRMRPR